MPAVRIAFRALAVQFNNLTLSVVILAQRSAKGEASAKSALFYTLVMLWLASGMMGCSKEPARNLRHPCGQGPAGNGEGGEGEPPTHFESL
ncbi:MAG: hypothetical protein MZV70_30055 [Desulfobacterales bacterium]|nr:hypothetical protein [Desulfobacterales bacterium]